MQLYREKQGWSTQTKLRFTFEGEVMPMHVIMGTFAQENDWQDGDIIDVHTELVG